MRIGDFYYDEILGYCVIVDIFKFNKIKIKYNRLNLKKFNEKKTKIITRYETKFKKTLQNS